ncbi:MAG: patatin family protein [Clostridia bacterium]|nr:patatin family protein [Clostridia bacterium]
MKTALILEGGAMRGLFTAGVLDYFTEKKLSFDLAVGVSAGAAFGCNLKSHQKGRVLRYNTTYCRDKRYCSLKNLLTTGDLYGADFCYRMLPDVLDPFDYESYREDPCDFWCVCTDAESAEPVYKQINSLTNDEFLYMRASASLPLVSRAVEVDGRRLLDGGISDSIPLDFAKRMGADKCVLILTRPKGYRKKPIAAKALIRLLLRKSPRLADAICTRHVRYNRTVEQIEDAEGRGEVFVIRPSAPIDVRVAERDSSRLARAHAEGLKHAENAFDALLAYLNKVE